MLRVLLQDASIQNEIQHGKKEGVYFIRKAAYGVLRSWNIEVKRPQLIVSESGKQK